MYPCDHAKGDPGDYVEDDPCDYTDGDPVDYVEDNPSGYAEGGPENMVEEDPSNGIIDDDTRPNGLHIRRSNGIIQNRDPRGSR